MASRSPRRSPICSPGNPSSPPSGKASCSGRSSPQPSLRRGVKPHDAETGEDLRVEARRLIDAAPDRLRPHHLTAQPAGADRAQRDARRGDILSRRLVPGVPVEAQSQLPSVRQHPLHSDEADGLAGLQLVELVAVGIELAHILGGQSDRERRVQHLAHQLEFPAQPAVELLPERVEEHRRASLERQSRKADGPRRRPTSGRPARCRRPARARPHGARRAGPRAQKRPSRRSHEGPARRNGRHRWCRDPGAGERSRSTSSVSLSPRPSIRSSARRSESLAPSALKPVTMLGQRRSTAPLPPGRRR